MFRADPGPYGDSRQSGNVKGYAFDPDVMLPPKNGKLDVAERSDRVL